MALEPHGILPEINHDEGAREGFVFSFKSALLGHYTPANRSVYEKAALPAFQRQHGRAPQDKREVASVMERQPQWHMFSSLNRVSQELMWDTCIDRCARQDDALVAKARRIGSRRGSLTLDPGIEMPRYIESLDTHVQPGGYYTEQRGDDLFAGAVYDTGVHLYFVGGLGPRSDELGISGIQYLREKFPQLRPGSILDLGCSIGHSTLPYADVYPDAELHAVDVSAPLLRYGHARAESLGKAVHFRQANAEALPYDDASFDLVLSHILFHETSAQAMPRILRECHRLLKPGGLMLHIEVAAFDEDLPTDYDRFARDWPGPYNAEPFWSSLHGKKLKPLATAAGFSHNRVFEDHAARAHADAAQKSFGPAWHILGATKD